MFCKTSTFLILTFIFHSQLFGQNDNKQFTDFLLKKKSFRVEINSKIVLNELNKYLDKYRADLKKEGLPIMIIEQQSHEAFSIYLSAIIYRSDLNKAIPNYYTLMNGIPVLIYLRPTSVTQKQTRFILFKRLFYPRLMNNLDGNEKQNPDFIPVEFDPQNVELRIENDKLIYSKNISMEIIYKMIGLY